MARLNPLSPIIAAGRYVIKAPIKASFYVATFVALCALAYRYFNPNGGGGPGGGGGGAPHDGPDGQNPRGAGQPQGRPGHRDTVVPYGGDGLQPGDASSVYQPDQQSDVSGFGLDSDDDSGDDSDDDQPYLGPNPRPPSPPLWQRDVKRFDQPDPQQPAGGAATAAAAAAQGSNSDGDQLKPWQVPTAPAWTNPQPPLDEASDPTVHGFVLPTVGLPGSREPQAQAAAAALPVRTVGPGTTLPAQAVHDVQRVQEISIGQSITATLDAVLEEAVRYRFTGYGLGCWSENLNQSPSSCAIGRLVSGNVLVTASYASQVPGIGTPGTCYLWKGTPNLEAIDNFCYGMGIKGNPTMRFDDPATYENFALHSKALQEAVLSANGVESFYARNCAKALAGVTLSATMECKVNRLLKQGPEAFEQTANVHYIMQSGMNINGLAYGGLFASYLESDTSVDMTDDVNNFIQANTKAAIMAALANESDVLVYNIGIGSGQFAGSNGNSIKQQNINALLAEIDLAKARDVPLRIVVPNIGFSKGQIQQLEGAGVVVAKGDKGVIAALLAQKGLRVSETVVVDPMTLYGIQSPGRHLGTNRSLSDEGRLHLYTPSYLLGFMRRTVVDGGISYPNQHPLTQFMWSQQPAVQPAPVAQRSAPHVPAGTYAAAAAAVAPVHGGAQGDNIAQILADVKKSAESNYKFSGYSLGGYSRKTSTDTYRRGHYTEAASYKPMIDAEKNLLQVASFYQGHSAQIIKGIGKPCIVYKWQQGINAEGVKAIAESHGIHSPLRLDLNGLKYSTFDGYCEELQQGVIKGKGISDPSKILNMTTALGGVTLSATLPYRADMLFKTHQPENVNIHCIFQCGLNFAGVGGGGIPIDAVIKTEAIEPTIKSYYKKIAQAAVDSAIRNGSDALCFNLGIGTGFFGGQYGDAVKESSIKGIIAAAEAIKARGQSLEITVPWLPGIKKALLNDLEAAGIHVIKADKGAVAALLAKRGLKVSETIAGDPMSMYGIHGLGFWWQTAGSASDEERIAFIAPCYLMSYGPLEVCEAKYTGGQETLVEAAPLSQYMV